MATIGWCPIFPKWDIYQPLYIIGLYTIFKYTYGLWTFQSFKLRNTVGLTVGFSLDLCIFIRHLQSILFMLEPPQKRYSISIGASHPIFKDLEPNMFLPRDNYPGCSPAAAEVRQHTVNQLSVIPSSDLTKCIPDICVNMRSCVRKMWSSVESSGYLRGFSVAIFDYFRGRKYKSGHVSPGFDSCAVASQQPGGFAGNHMNSFCFFFFIGFLSSDDMIPHRIHVCSIWVCLKMVSTPFYPMVNDHYPY